MSDTKTTLAWVMEDKVSGPAKKIGDQLDKTGDKSKSMGDKLQAGMKVGALAFVAVAGAAVAVGAEVFDLGAKYEAMDAKAQTVFGSEIGKVKQWADANAAAMGLTSREATGLAANMGDLLIPLGFTRDEAAKMSTDIVGLSGALSEWSGGTRSASEVAEILQKSLLGERDGLKELGISISEADVSAQLLKDGTANLTGEQLAQAKATATQELIFAKSTDAQAAYQKGTAKGIRSQHELTAKFNEAKESLVTALYPILVKVTSFIAENLPKAIKIAGGIFTWLSKNIFPALGVGIGIVINFIKGMITIVGTLVGVFQGVAGVIKRIWDGVTSAIKGAINFVIDIINGVIRGINKIQVHIDVGPVKIDWDGLKMKPIPKLHSGGIVPGAAGSDQLALLQAGERVIPNGGGTEGVFIKGITERELVDMVDRGLYFRLQRAAPTLGRT